jgi:hypothetical protein
MFFRFAGGSFWTALLRNRGRLRAALSRKIAAHLQRRLTAILHGKSQPRFGTQTAPFPVSLTSWRPRLPALNLTLLTLLEQSRRPSAILVWLAPADLPILPPALRDLFESFGVQFRQAEDLGPHKKWLPMIQTRANHPFVICDDDTIYPRTWFESLLADARPDCYVGCRCHRMTLTIQNDKCLFMSQPGSADWQSAVSPIGNRRGSGTSDALYSHGKLAPYFSWEKEIRWDGRPSRLAFVTGCGGAIINPGRLPLEFLDETQIMRLCPRADDIWLNLAHLVAGVPCFKTRYSFPCLNLAGTEDSGLARANVDEGGNDRQLAAVLKHFDIDILHLVGIQTPSGVTGL